MNYLTALGAAAVFMIIVSTDLLVCAFGYGVSKIHVPFRKVMVINLIGSLMIGTGLFVGYYIGSLLDDVVANGLAFGVLFGLGLFKITGWFLNRKKATDKKMRPITWAETIVLAVVLSFDGLAIGFGATIDDFGLAFILTVLVMSLVTDMFVFALGQRIGKRITKNTKLDLSWLSGALLMMLATVGLFL